MPYNPSIPGQVSEHQLKAIEAVASLVPQNGKVVEVGSLFGSSSWTWAKSVDPSVTVYCIDPWEGNEGVRAMEARYGITYGIEQFKRHTADCPNIRPLQGYSPTNFLDWSDPIDLYYEDAVHVNPILARNLEFWSGKLKPGGIVCGDDYRPRFPDVRAGAEDLARRLGRDLIRVDFFWCLLPGEDALPGSAAAAERLRELGRESDVLKRGQGIVIAAGPRQPIPVVGVGESTVVPCRVANDGIDAWPSEAGGRLGFGVRMVAANNPDEVLVESRVSLPVAQLQPDMPTDADLVLPTATLPPGSYRAVFDVLGPDGTWTIHPRIAANRGNPIEVRDPSSPKPGNVSVATGPTPSLSPSDNSLYRFGEAITFSTAGQSQRYTRDGWVAPEARHRWMLGENSRLVLAVEKLTEGVVAGRTLHLTLTLRPFVSPGKLERQRLSIIINGKHVFEDTIDTARVIEASLPAAHFLGDTTIDLIFYHPDAARPCDILKESTDKKLLSFSVSEMCLSLD